MKTLADGTQVPEAVYYFLLDWNERNFKQYINETFNKNRLCDLNITEYIDLFNEAAISTNDELRDIRYKLTL